MNFSTLFLQLVLISLNQSAKYLPIEGNVPGTSVSSVLGMLTNLPCNMTPSVPGDRILLVLWYKDGYGKPLYSFDLRSIQDSVEVIWANELKDRVNLNIKSKLTAFLTLLGVEERDQGTYRCRVDFKKSPTCFTDVKLSITVPPKEVFFLDEKGSEIKGEVGPYLEGSTLVITCDVGGGWPSSHVTWWRDGELLDSSWEEISPGKSRNTLKIESLRRGDMNAVLECSGNNNNQSKPVSSTINVHMLLGPVSVDILGPGPTLSVDTEYRWECISSGASPPPLISWWSTRGAEIPSSQQNFDEESRSVCTVSYTPSIQDQGKALTCRVEHDALRTFMEASAVLSVKYKPSLVVSLGPNIDEQSIKAGDDLYFTCSTAAVPPVTNIIWNHNGQSLKRNPGSGFIQNQDNLIIRNITTVYEGDYTCEGSNSEGSGVSNTVHVAVQYLPKCKGDIEYRRVTRGDNIHLVCPVLSHPAPVDFRWSLNTSTTMRPVQGDGRGGMSYTPVVDSDYGTVLCWGINKLGQQIHPCIFHIYPTGKPESVSNCTVYNITSSSLRVHCKPGSDNGSSQQFVLQIFQISGTAQGLNPTNSRLVNKDSPTFLVNSLEAGTGFTLRVFSYNDNGESEAVEDKVSTLSVENQKHISEEGPIPVKMTSLVWVFLSILSVLVLLLVIVGTILRISTVCSRSYKQKPSSQTYINHADKNKEEVESPMIAQNNPDIIPDKERGRNLQTKRRSSYNNENSQLAKERRRTGDQRAPVNSMYCTLPKPVASKPRYALSSSKSSYQIPGTELSILYESGSQLQREESSAEDLTAEGRRSLLSSDPPPAPPEFADKPPNMSSTFYQIIREDSRGYDLNTTRF